MKKILFSLIFLCSLLFVQAQEPQQLPIDAKVRLGKLENGLTYYIRHNSLPKERADFYIAQKVGAVLEEDNQNGLAHFLEHMAFNGSANFPGNRVVDYLESIGVKFGYNLNAYTNCDETVYNISNVPVLTLGAVDSCLLILHDWSSSLLLDENEINKERGVIREEMRTYGGADWRMQEKLFPQIMPGSRYTERNVIGTEEIILNFKPETLRAFYEKWYRPDLQGIIIVGDIDVNEIEEKVKAIFGDIPTPVNPAERIYFPIEDNVEPLVGIATDKEATLTTVSIYFKHEPVSREFRGTIAYFINNYFNSIISLVMNERIQELIQQSNPPFIAAGIANSSFMGTAAKDALFGIAYIKDDNIEMGMKALSREIERLNRYGFTASEYERAKANLISRYETLFNEREKTQNRSFSLEYVDHFVNGGYIPGVEVEYNILTAMAPQIPVEAINEYIQELIGEENIVISLTAPEKENFILPTKAQLLTWFEDAKDEEIQPVEETDDSQPLMQELPDTGSVKEEVIDPVFETVNLVLSNGVKVVIKPTLLKDDQILMNAFSPGGSSLFPEKEMANIKLYNDLSVVGGLADFSQPQLRKILAGKKVSVQPYITLRYEGIRGSSSVKDFETLLQLVYLNFTAPRADEDAFLSFIGRYKSQLEQQDADPEIAFVDTLLNEVNVNKIRAKRLKADDLENVNYETIMKWRKDRYVDASDFTFVFTGNIDPESVKDILAQYLGSLPVLNRKEKAADIEASLTSGVKRNHFKQPMENAKSIICDLYWTTMDDNIKNVVSVDMFKQILQIVFTEKIREDEGGTYGINTSAYISDYPQGQTPLQIYFETQPGKEDYLNDKVHEELSDIAHNGPRLEDFNKVKEYMLKKQKEREEENEYWSSIISEYYKRNYDGYTEYMKFVNSMTPGDIQKIAKLLLDSNNLIEVVMTGIK